MMGRVWSQAVVLKAALAVCSLGLLAGCASLHSFPNNPEASSTLTKRVDVYFGANAEVEYQKAAGADRTSIRNDIVNNRIRIIGDELTEYQGELRAARVDFGFGTDLLALTLNGLGATTGGAATKAALSAAAGGFTSANGALAKDVFESQTIDAITAQMTADFDKGRAAIYVKLQQQPDSVYPLSVASTDVSDLFRSIGIANALNEISQQAKTQQSNAKAHVDDVESGAYATTDSSSKIKAWLHPGGTLDKQRAAALQAWIDEQPEVKASPMGLPFAFLARSDSKDSNFDLEELRQRAFSDPALIKLNIGAL